MIRKNKQVKAKENEMIHILVIMYASLVYMATIAAMSVNAAGDPLTVVNNLSEFIYSLIRAIGLILLGFGIVQIGLSLKSHDPSQRANVRPDLGAVKVVTL